MEDFFALVETRDHAWPAGRRDLHWHLLPDHATATELADRYRAVTHRPGLVPVPAEWMHMTVLHAGPEADTTPGEIDQIVERVRAVTDETPPVELTVARPAVGNVAVECQARPGAPARHLWETTRAATAAVVGDRGPLLPSRHYPHMSLAYAARDAQLVDRLALKVDLSDTPGDEVPIRFTTVTLVSQWHDHHHIKWDVLTHLDLKGTEL